MCAECNQQVHIIFFENAFYDEKDLEEKRMSLFENCQNIVKIIHIFDKRTSKNQNMEYVNKLYLTEVIEL